MCKCMMTALEAVQQEELTWDTEAHRQIRREPTREGSGQRSSRRANGFPPGFPCIDENVSGRYRARSLAVSLARKLRVCNVAFQVLPIVSVTPSVRLEAPPNHDPQKLNISVRYTTLRGFPLIPWRNQAIRQRLYATKRKR